MLLSSSAKASGCMSRKTGPGRFRLSLVVTPTHFNKNPDSGIVYVANCPGEVMMGKLQKELPNAHNTSEVEEAET